MLYTWNISHVDFHLISYRAHKNEKKFNENTVRKTGTETYIYNWKMRKLLVNIDPRGEKVKEALLRKIVFFSSTTSTHISSFQYWTRVAGHIVLCVYIKILLTHRHTFRNFFFFLLFISWKTYIPEPAKVLAWL